MELSRDKLPDNSASGTLDFREGKGWGLNAAEKALTAVMGDQELTVSERLRRADMLATTDSDVPVVIREPENTPGFVMW